MTETVVPFLQPPEYPDPVRVRRAWQKHQDQWQDPNALINQVGQQLLIRLEEIKIKPQKILNFGSRSGLITQQLRKKWPKATVVAATFSENAAKNSAPYQGLLRRSRQPALVAAGNALPFKRNGFDVVLSNMALHWSGNPAATLREMRRILKPGGALLITVPGAESLQELKSCLARIDETFWGRVWPRVPHFMDMREFGDLLASSGFTQPIADRDPIQATFADTETLIGGLKRMGAGNHHANRLKGLTPKGYIQQLDRLYQQQFGQPDGGITVSMEILFGHGWKADPNRPEEQPIQSCSLPSQFS
ncbi:MAG: methyltransferase domain-containing protein [Magnetococcales bacterium]|nr:methyltransferase domain-containing protein [Magnetococcales bacterium]